MTHRQAREFIRNHFEEFVNKKNVQIGNLNFAPNCVDHGADVPPGMPPEPAGAIAYVGGALKRFPDLHVTIEDMIAEDDKVVVRNHWAAIDLQTGKKLEFRGIVIWRIAARQIVERWAYLEPPHSILALTTREAGSGIKPPLQIRLRLRRISSGGQSGRFQFHRDA